MKKKFGRASSVGVIGGATAVFVVSKKKIEKRRIEQEAFLDRAQKLARPCAKSFSETVTYLREVYGAQPCELSKGQWQSAKVNIILNLHPELVDRQPFPKNPTKAQLQEWSRQDTSFEQALAYPEDALGLLIEGYRIPVENARILRERERQSRPPVRKSGWPAWLRAGLAGGAAGSRNR